MSLISFISYLLLFLYSAYSLLKDNVKEMYKCMQDDIWLRTQSALQSCLISIVIFDTDYFFDKE